MMKRKVLLKKMKSRYFILLCFLVSVLHMAGQDVRLTSVNPEADILVISNSGASMVDLTNYQLCRGPGTYVQIGALSPISGSVMLAGGSDIELSYTMANLADGFAMCLLLSLNVCLELQPLTSGFPGG